MSAANQFQKGRFLHLCTFSAKQIKRQEQSADKRLVQPFVALGEQITLQKQRQSIMQMDDRCFHYGES